MLWGIDTASWAELWSGVIGSFIAAVIGGLVALIVVRMTKTHGASQEAKTREIAAIADFLASSEAVYFLANEQWNEIPDLFLSMRSAVARLRMSGGDVAELVVALDEGPHDLASLKLCIHGIDKRGEDVGAHEKALGKAVRRLADVLPGWPHASDDDRLDVLSKVAAIGKELRTAAVAAEKADGKPVRKATKG